jgi:hypothetical protein
MKNTLPTERLVLVIILALSLTARPLTAVESTNQIPNSARVALEKSEQFELLSIDPDIYSNRRPNEEFQGHRILGSMMVTNAEVRSELVTALKKSVEESKGAVANCFNPRHGIRVIFDEKTNDFVICFQCLQVATYENNRATAGFLISDSTQATESLFNRVLMKRKIPLAGR